jgi:hypothetical protein
MNRRTVLTTLGGLGLLGCGPKVPLPQVDQIVFDRGDFSITFENLVNTGLQLLGAAIVAHTKKGVASEYAKRLQAFYDDVVKVKERVEGQIRAVPAQVAQAAAQNQSQLFSGQGISDIVDILAKAIPIILPLLLAAA